MNQEADSLNLSTLHYLNDINQIVDSYQIYIDISLGLDDEQIIV